ncbi:hypothetical protein EV359DRAFT_78854 [Lentinula novae-zelandiae]|nr:hypothetical protein EV359DRAFT_78854 [Lentinula novae-zelandiae]
MELESADCLASLVSSQLTLEEIRDITFARKGKAREDNPVTDEEIAFKLFEEENAAVVGSLRLAFSLQHALDVDQAILAKLSVEELGAVDDHRYAQALSLGQVLPDKSDAQKALEDSAVDSEAWKIKLGSVPRLQADHRHRTLEVVNPFESTVSSVQIPFAHQIPFKHHAKITTASSVFGTSSWPASATNIPLRCCQQSLPVADAPAAPRRLADKI